ncbi:MAG: hypothetical protein ACLQVI_15090 [Polyangiaceae bacterium]|jgi:hypothetical protein
MTKISGFSLVLGLLAVGALGCGSSPPPASSSPSTSSGSTASAGTGDSDGDGILDKDDKCPDKKEDGLAPDPKDGCPKS